MATAPQELLLWRQLLRSLRAYANYTIADSPQENGAGNSAERSVNHRDAQMAENLIWLAERRYSGRKIIVWAASFHIMRNAAEIEVPSKVVDDTDVVPMGHLVDQKFGNDVFSIGFTAGAGEAGAWFRPSFDLDAPPEGTLEDLCLRAGIENGIAPLRQAVGNSKPIPEWLTEKIYSRPLGYTWMKANWSRHFDALIFQKTMQPAKPVR